LKFAPYADECTTFKYVRRLRFDEESVEIIMTNGEGEKLVFRNSKPFVLCYDTKTSKILNTLQIVRLTSEKIKVKHSLEELIILSDIQGRLQDWVKNRHAEVV